VRREWRLDGRRFGVGVDVVGEWPAPAAPAEVTFLLDGVERCVPLTVAAAVLPLEATRPVRSFPSYRG
jgi:hypothetical protein